MLDALIIRHVHLQEVINRMATRFAALSAWMGQPVPAEQATFVHQRHSVLHVTHDSHFTHTAHSVQKERSLSWAVPQTTLKICYAARNIKLQLCQARKLRKQHEAAC